MKHLKIWKGRSHATIIKRGFIVRDYYSYCYYIYMCLTKCQFDNMTKLSSIISQLQRQEKFIMKNQTVKNKVVVYATVD